MHPTLKTALYALPPLLLFIMTTALVTASPQSVTPNYHLAITFNTARNMLIGTARINISIGETFTLHTNGLTITGILLKRQDGSSHELPPQKKPFISVPASNQEQEVFISYTFSASENSDNRIEGDAITLLSNWYPQPDRRMRYTLSADLPHGFTAVTESDHFPLQRHGNVTIATFKQPASAIHFAAASYTMDSIEVRDDLKVYTLFFTEDAALARGYLEKARDYIRRYEHEIGPFPYNHYVIVANRNPTGLGMPTFTLLGQSVLRLPFIKDTSLGHEILHSWFGNSVGIDPAQGNWCEGLTTYLSDHAYRKDKEEGAIYRKESIVNYLNYVNDNNVIPLSDFSSASHAQVLAQARRAVGYSKSAMLFHELHERVGDDNFNSAIRNFYTQFMNRTASWYDIRDVFNTASPDYDLNLFFTERLSRTDIPSVYADSITISQKDDSSLLQFQLMQRTTSPYSLNVPVRVTTGQGEYYFEISASTLKTEVSLPLPGRPLEFTLDPEYTFFRQLERIEYPPVWSQFMGSDTKLAILQSPEARQLFAPLLQHFRDSNWTIAEAKDIANSQLQDVDLLVLGLDQDTSRNLFGSPVHPQEGFTLDVRRNPLSPEHVAVLVSSSNKQETAAVASRLIHYGKNGYLHFERGRPTERRIPESAYGIRYQLEQLPIGGSTKPLKTFATVASELSSRDVIYIGENHTSASDHILQLRLIEAIADHVPDLAIGMEMFPTTSQDALDNYVLSDKVMTEKEFLKASRYFEVWSYDYRYFREIFNFARRKNIPVIGLNLERNIVSTVYTTGSTDSLPEKTLSSLPPERDLDMPGYGERLQAIHIAHEQGSHGNGMASGFIQAQALWDETMAENIADHLRHHPGRKIIVLAGTQHTRKDSGIPPRVARRIPVEQASVLNISDSSPPPDLIEVADYYFLSESVQFDEQPKMGIVLKEQATPDAEHIEIIDFSPESKAPDAGLEKGDILRSIDGYTISNMADIRISMLDAHTLDTIQVQVERRTGNESKQLEYKVELIRTGTGKPHP